MRSLNVLVVLTGAAALFGTLSSGCFLVPECVQCNEANTGGGTAGTAGTGGTGTTGGTGGTSGMGGIGGTGGSTGSTTSMPPLMCDPSVDNVVDEDCGVFVSSSKGDDMAGDGTKAKPFATIAKALGAAGDMERVYLCAEGFAEAVSISKGVVIHGGLDCSDVKWPWVGATTKTKIAPSMGEIPLTVDAQVELTVEDVAFEATASDAAGSSSIAIIADAGAALTMTRCDVTAGVGQAGADGEDLPAGPATPVKGIDGSQACSAGEVAGGASVENLCDPGNDKNDSFGGAGGPGKKTQGSNGDSGLPVEGSAVSNGGMGQLNDMGMCSNGDEGASGAAGANGAGGTGLGTISNSGYQGAAGIAGEKGRPGQGGGGGGGAKGGSGSGECQDGGKAGGASGGSGGAGGCGGLGGNGGQAGGSSIGILSLGATLTFTEVTITTGQGGKGGDGKIGQTGGPGGTGGAGGEVPDNVSGLKPGCAGGKGGKGGNGGAGGGGRGGHSIGIAYTGDLPPSAGVTIMNGMSGTGGIGAGMEMDNMGGVNNGADGIVEAMKKFD